MKETLVAKQSKSTKTNDTTVKNGGQIGGQNKFLSVIIHYFVIKKDKIYTK
jgi:hypothetical protein